jgi:excisionase family DNA binding protein
MVQPRETTGHFLLGSFVNAIRLTPDQIAARWRCSRRTVERLVEAGRLRAFDIGAGKRPRWRVTLDDLERFENERANTPAPKPRRVKRANDIPNYFAEATTTMNGERKLALDD